MSYPKSKRELSQEGLPVILTRRKEENKSSEGEYCKLYRKNRLYYVLIPTIYSKLPFFIFIMKSNIIDFM